MDVAHGGMVSAELNRLIEKRSSRKTDPDEQDDLWKASVAAYNARRREEMREAWCEYHEGQAERHRRTLQDLIAHHVTQAAKLCEGRGVRS
jgi:hypothetical protein